MKKVHLIGIKGVGMTALALILKDKGVQVTGSDVDKKFITDSVLQQANIKVFSSFSAKHITPNLNDIVHSGAYNSTNNIEVAQAYALHLPVFTQQEYLAKTIAPKQQICIAGVGGKTTTSALFAYLLTKLGRDVGYFVGTGNFSGFLPGHWGQDQLFIVESDEYANLPHHDNTPKFLLLKPHAIVLPNLAYDHPDIYSSSQQTLQIFTQFLRKLPADGPLFYNYDSLLIRKLLTKFRPQSTTSIGFHKDADWYISDINYDNEYTITSIFHKNKKFVLKLLIFGRHNVINSVLAASFAFQQGFPWSAIQDVLSTFRGLNRRQEYKGQYQGALFYDDYGHHPQEIAYTIQAFKTRFPRRRLWVLFEPHTYTRTAAFLSQFSQALSLADKVSLLPIFASAREKNLSTTLTSQDIAKLMTVPTNLLDYNQAPEYILNHLSSRDLVLTMGAGTIYKIHNHLPLLQ